LRLERRLALGLDDEPLRAPPSVEIDASVPTLRTSTVQPSASKAASTARFAASSVTARSPRLVLGKAIGATAADAGDDQVHSIRPT
jgi:hypothetical protein